jgi:hypothetical protein
MAISSAIHDKASTENAPLVSLRTSPVATSITCKWPCFRSEPKTRASVRSRARASSSAPGSSPRVNAMRVPSFDHSKRRMAVGSFVSCLASPPATSIT